MSLSEAYDFCSIAARLPMVFLYFQGFLVSLSLIYQRRRCKKTTAAAQVHKTQSQWTKRENRVVCTDSRSVLDKENSRTLRNFTLNAEKAKICRHLKIREGGELVTDHV